MPHLVVSSGAAQRRSATVALAATLSWAAAAVGREGPRPNVLFIAVDDLRPQLGCYGDPLVKTPHLDRLAQRGVVFERAYCQQALCSPSRISLMAGRRAETTGIFSIGPTLRSAMPDVVTLPQMFKQHGWRTRSLGKVYHVGIDDPDSWSEPSWQSSKPRYGPEIAADIRARLDAMKAAGAPIPRQGPGIPRGPAFEAPDVGDDDLTDGDIAREAVTALRDMAARPDHPFFLAVGFHNPHVPWVAPRKYWDLYPPAAIRPPADGRPPAGAPDWAATTGEDFYWYSNVPADRKITPDFGRQCLHGYLAAISYVDAMIGRILDELERLRLADSTIVTVWGDHGYYMGEHGWWGGKHNTYEGATRAPLIVAAPARRARGRSRALVEFIDIFPTLAELAALPVPPGVEGRSFAAQLDDLDAPGKAGAISQYPKRGFLGTALRTDRYRYVEWTDSNGAVAARELYDYDTDPAETRNVAADAAPELLERLAAILRQLRTDREVTR